MKWIFLAVGIIVFAFGMTPVVLFLVQGDGSHRGITHISGVNETLIK